MSTSRDNFFKSNVLGHPSGLFVLFFTEMWERFSFYGMRVLLINFLTMAAISYNPGWSWSAENAGALFGTYAMLLYITPIAGGIIADKFTGSRWAVVIGAAIMTLGHASMALDTEFSLYAGLALLVIGTGFFKPNITSIISKMYVDLPEKKDGAYTIFYMGVNAGAFFGMMLCGYLAERVGWSWGFGLAGIFMLLGTLQFWLAKPLFGNIGDKETKEEDGEAKNLSQDEKLAIEKKNPFTRIDVILIVICAIIGLGYAINDPMSKIAKIDLFSALGTESIEGQYIALAIGIPLFLFLSFSRIFRYSRIIRDRMIAFIIFAFFTVFFWMSFEQGATSLIIFARDYVQREMVGNSAIIFNAINALLTIVPLAIISWVLFLLFKKTAKKILPSNLILILCFGIIWIIVGWMLYRDFNTSAFEVTYNAEMVPVVEDGQPVIDEETGNQVFTYKPITTQTDINSIVNDIVPQSVVIGEPFVNYNVGDKVKLIHKDNERTVFGILDAERLQGAIERGQALNQDNGVIDAEISAIKSNWVEITVSWFSILNSFFIIVFASLFSKWWDSKYNPSASMKYGLGLIVMAVGFGLLAYGVIWASRRNESKYDLVNYGLSFPYAWRALSITSWSFICV